MRQFKVGREGEIRSRLSLYRDTPSQVENDEKSAPVGDTPGVTFSPPASTVLPLVEWRRRGAGRRLAEGAGPSRHLSLGRR